MHLYDILRNIMRFENRLNKENLKINTLNPCWDDEEGTAKKMEQLKKMTSIQQRWWKNDWKTV